MDGIITSVFGERKNPILNIAEFHNGIDIAVEEGTFVKAVKDGVITEVETSETYGKYIKYETYDNYIIMFAHLSEILVKEGQKVEKGQDIALSGSTGLSTGPHLHYSIWKEQQLIDPIDYVDLPYTEQVKKEMKH